MKLLSGSEIIHQKLNGPKELPSSGWKEYCPTNSWLEQKQIQASLEDKYLTLGVERIEKQSNLAQAEWNHACKKAKVLKKVGKHWEVVGHHQDNEDWLFPEEALYLLEINVLELLYCGVPVSIEHAYALLLSELHYCTLQEYRVYSYLSRKGYKLIRHAEDIRVTRYEKQIHLDQVLETQKRNVPTENIKVDSPSEQEVPKSLDDSSVATASLVEKFQDNLEARLEKTKECPSKPVSDSEDVCIIEDNIEIIEIEDSSFKKSPLKHPVFESCDISTNKSVKSVKAEYSIVIDDDDEDDDYEDEDMEVKQESESESSEYSSEDDVVLVKTFRLGSREWYKPLRKCLIPSQIEFIDLSDDVEVKIEKTSISDDSLRILTSRTTKDILDDMISAKSGETFIKRPNPCFVPAEIVPKYSQYKVNLNMRQELNHQHQGPYHYFGRRQQQNFYNSNYSNNQANNTFQGNSMFVQAYEMRALGMSMIQAATSLMSAVNTQGADPSLINNISSFLNPSLFSNPTFAPRLYNNNMFNNSNSNNNNSLNNNLFGNPRHIPRNNMSRNYSYGRRSNRFFRGYRNISTRGTYQQKQMLRYYNKNRNNSNILEMVTIDSDDEISEPKVKRRGNHIELPPKKSRHSKPIELIDLCVDDNPVKPEPVEKCRNEPSCSVFSGSSKVLTLPKQENVECKQELDPGSKERLRNDEAPIDSKNEVDLQITYETDLKIEKEVELEKEVISDIECNDSRIKSVEKSLPLSDINLYESSQGKIDLSCSQSPQIIEESNDIEMSNAECNTVEDEGDIFEKDTENDEPTCWQQYKEQTEVDVEAREEEGIPLIQPEQIKDAASLLKNLQIFEPMDADVNDESKKLKISFDAYLPSDHFKKTLKTLPKFRIIVVNSSDPLPSNSDIETLRSSYQDGTPFLYAVVCDDRIAFYIYDTICLPDYCRQ